MRLEYVGEELEKLILEKLVAEQAEALKQAQLEIQHLTYTIVKLKNEMLNAGWTRRE